MMWMYNHRKLRRGNQQLRTAWDAQDDFNNQLWNVVMLAMGGSALGEAVSSSGLLADIAQRIQDGVQGYGTWQVAGLLCLHGLAHPSLWHAPLVQRCHRAEHAPGIMMMTGARGAVPLVAAVMA